MSKRVDIEYCGSWGYGGAAMRAKKAVQEVYPDAEVSCHSAKGVTGTIKVSWVKEGQLQTVWEKGRGQTDCSEGREEIVKLLKQSEWFSHTKQTSFEWRELLKSMDSLWE